MPRFRWLSIGEIPQAFGYELAAFVKVFDAFGHDNYGDAIDINFRLLAAHRACPR